MKKIYRTDMTVFDFITNDFGNDLIDSIITDDLTDTDNVTKLTFEKLDLNENKQINTAKKRNRKIIISVIAAVLTAAIIGTAAVSASDGLSMWFHRTFLFEPPENIFSIRDVEIESDIVNIDFHGVTGNEHQAESNMTITAKDGTDFIDEEWVKDEDNLIISYAYLPEYSIDYYEQHSESDTYKNGNWHKCSDSEQSSNTAPPHRVDGLYYTSLHFIDSKTINASGIFISDHGNIMGQRFYSEFDTIYVSHIDKVLYTLDDFENYEEWKKFIFDPETERKIKEEYKSSLAEDQYICYRENQALVIATKKEIPLKYKVCLTLDYGTIKREFINTEKEFIIKNRRYKICSMYSDVYNLIIKIEKDDNNDDSGIFKIIIQLKDGTTVSSAGYTGYTDPDNENILVHRYTYSNLENKNNAEGFYGIDPYDIVSIEAGGVKLYG